MIRSAALQTRPSDVDVLGWRRLCTTFKSISIDLTSIAPFVASRVIALDKNPGVCPISIGDTVRRIIARGILNITRMNSLQLCTVQISGIEAVVHAVHTFFQKETEAILCRCKQYLQLLSLHNIQKHSSCLATVLINTYRVTC